MGCGDSKLSVATSNTILRRKKSNAGDSTKKSNDIGTITDVTPQEQHEQEAAASNGEQVAVNKDNADVVVAEDVKDIKENGDEKEIIDNGDNKVLLLLEHETGRLISEDSPKNLFSSRKLEEEGIDALISEGRSGTSDYYTPRHGAGSKGNVNFKADEESGNALEDHDDKELLPAAEETKPAETTTEKEGGPAAILAGDPGVVLVEEKLVQEPAEVEITTTIVEAKISTPTAEEEKEEEK